MVPVPPITGSELSRDILRSLNVPDSVIDKVGKETPPKLLLGLINDILETWMSTVQEVGLP